MIGKCLCRLVAQSLRVTWRTSHTLTFFSLSRDSSGYSQATILRFVETSMMIDASQSRVSASKGRITPNNSYIHVHRCIVSSCATHTHYSAVKLDTRSSCSCNSACLSTARYKKQRWGRSDEQGRPNPLVVVSYQLLRSGLDSGAFAQLAQVLQPTDLTGGRLRLGQEKSGAVELDEKDSNLRDERSENWACFIVGWLIHVRFAQHRKRLFGKSTEMFVSAHRLSFQRTWRPLAVLTWVLNVPTTTYKHTPVYAETCPGTWRRYWTVLTYA